MVAASGTPHGPFNRNTRTGSYAVNGWLTIRLWSSQANLTNGPTSARILHGEAGIEQVSATPVIGDGVALSSIPEASDPAPSNLFDGDAGKGARMSQFCIPRHGSRPTSAPNPWPPGGRLPGAVNIGFYDGHAEPVPLEGLWQLYWHRGYTPTTRPASP
jgi:prepilin-type processing-associated H-X9-DG protein